MADTLDLRNQPCDPDAQAAVTDFLDYTEFFPSDLFRSLTLIGQLDEDYKRDTSRVHDLAKVYGNLPKMAPVERPDPQTVRKELSVALSHAIRCRESTYAEATRLYSLADGLYHRLVTIKKKLQSLPKPPSRDPSPVPQPKSPVANRNRKNDNERTPRITLHTDGNKTASRTHATSKPRQRVRRIIVPGEVLPPYEDASPNASDSESDSERAPTPAIPPIRLHEKTPADKALKVPKVTTIRIPRPPSSGSRVRPHGAMGTNVHSQVAGISVSNAMANLLPPPPDFKIGSRHAPWLKLTEWELNKLRKRMKKNADWVPSDTMVRRELAETGRGYENLLKARAHARATGEELVDEEPEAFIRPVTYRGYQGSSIEADTSTEQLENRGMKLNQAKKLKRQTMLQEQGESGQAGQVGTSSEYERPETAEEGASPEDSVDGNEIPTVGTIVIKPRETVRADPAEDGSKEDEHREDPRSHKKRKHEPENGTMDVMIDPALLMPSEYDTAPVQKKLKLGPPIVLPAATVIEEAAAELVPVVASAVNDSEMFEAPSEAPPEALPTSAVIPASNLDDSLQAQSEPDVTPTIAAPPPEEPEPGPSKVAAAPLPLPEPQNRLILELKPPKTAANRNNRSKKSATPIPDTAPPANEPPRPRSRGSAILSLTFNTNKTKAASAEPPPRRTSDRRASNVSLPSTQASPSKKTTQDVVEPEASGGTTTRRVRRPAPGLLASSDTNKRDGVQVILGKRKAAPSRKASSSKPLTLTTSTTTSTTNPHTSTANKRHKSASASASALHTPTGHTHEPLTEAEEYYNNELIDPSEPRYCICDRVSFGTMVACESDSCEKEWFHLECVGLEDIPPRRTKWYCPECRILLGVGEYGEPVSTGGGGEGMGRGGRGHSHR